MHDRERVHGANRNGGGGGGLCLWQSSFGLPVCFARCVAARKRTRFDDALARARVTSPSTVVAIAALRGLGSSESGVMYIKLHIYAHYKQVCLCRRPAGGARFTRNTVITDYSSLSISVSCLPEIFSASSVKQMVILNA